jgi:Uma2 family endonuclease
MNEHVRQSAGPLGQPRSTTQAAEGVPRWRWTLAELIRLTDMDVFTAEDRIELIGGEIVPMSPIGRRHEVVAEEIAEAWHDKVPSELRLMTERQLQLAEDTFTKPDLWVRPKDIRGPDVRGDTVLLVVEVADTNLNFDKTKKAIVYALHGVREYWVVDAQTLVTTVHREPSLSGYANVEGFTPTRMLTPLLVPQLALRLSELDVGS